MAIPFYRYSYERAKNDMALDAYRESEAENKRCLEYVQSPETGLYAKAYKSNCVDSDGAYTKLLVKKLGLERLMFLAASTVKAMPEDGRWTEEVREWGILFNASCRFGKEARQYAFTQINPGIVNILAQNLIKKFQNLNLFSSKHCEEECADMEGKVIVLSHTALKEEYWTPENQLWLATGGFGCRADARGRAVYATCLYDGEEARWSREQVAGVIKDEFLPDWAKKRLESIQNPNPENELDLN